ncbi:MAG: DUF3307 domain-containing protein [Bacteroidetes bacterium]|nr:DUF3307 domain-containing protein [Bacteroidota bacterium]
MQTKLLISLFICHWLADFTPLSTKRMLEAKKDGKKLIPILVHASVHATLMGLVMFYFIGISELSLNLILFQLLTHFIIDVCKGRLNFIPALQAPTNKLYWFVFGLDQLLHAIVIVLMVSFIVS